jgi:hypothetical protein
MKHIHKLFNKAFTAVFISLACTSLLIGCGAGNGEGLDENGNLLTADSTAGDTTAGDTTGGNGSLSGNPNATLAWLQSNVFGGVCSQCHTGAGAPLGVNWSSESDTCANVGNASGEINSLMEIDSGRPDQSYVIWKVQGAGPNGEAIVAELMPLNNPPLSAEAIQNMRDWISDGTPGCTVPAAAVVSTVMKSSRSENTDTRNNLYPVGSWMHAWSETLRTCSLCHSLTPSHPRCSSDLECPPNGIVLSADNYYGVVDGNTVAPFDLDRSILWQRVNEADPEKRMPLGFNELTATQLDILRNWIEGGARYCPQNMVCP